MTPLTVLRAAFETVESGLDHVFGAELNPMRHLGALGFYFLWIAFVSGIYVYIFFDTSVLGAYGSLEDLQREQWWLGGVMRSLHRYGSDGVVLFMALHTLRELAYDRYRGARWFSWLTGTPVMWLVIISGITGYWLVWDERAQYVAIVSAEWLDQVAAFGGVISRNFMTEGSLGDRFFTLLMFTHIAVPLFLLFGLWIHLQRMSRARIHPPKALFHWFSAAMIVLSLWKPALSQAPANLSIVPTDIDIDWFYLAFYPLFDGVWAAYVWPTGALVSLILMFLPWLPPGWKEPAATVQLEQCNGCRRCVDDCPYNAVSMQNRTDGRAFDEEAIVRADLCVACGICVGACPASTPFRRTSGLVTGIDLPGLPLKEVRAATMAAAAANTVPEGEKILIYACKNADGQKSAAKTNAAFVTIPCIGMLPPSFIDFVLSRGLADGVYLEGCGGGDCLNRFGANWTADRVAGIRDPYLRKRVPRERLVLGWQDGGSAGLAKRIESFRDRLRDTRETTEEGEA